MTLEEQYDESIPKTRDELEQKILSKGCDMLRGDMFLYARCITRDGDCRPCNKECPFFEQFFNSECKRLNL